MISLRLDLLGRMAFWSNCFLGTQRASDPAVRHFELIKPPSLAFVCLIWFSRWTEFAFVYPLPSAFPFLTGH
jgi:hypothetical protein